MSCRDLPRGIAQEGFSPYPVARITGRTGTQPAHRDEAGVGEAGGCETAHQIFHERLYPRQLWSAIEDVEAYLCGQLSPVALGLQSPQSPSRCPRPNQLLLALLGIHLPTMV